MIEHDMKGELVKDTAKTISGETIRKWIKRGDWEPIGCEPSTSLPDWKNFPVCEELLSGSATRLPASVWFEGLDCAPCVVSEMGM